MVWFCTTTSKKWFCAENGKKRTSRTKVCKTSMMVGKTGNQYIFLQWAGIFNKSFGKGNKKVRAMKQLVIFTWIKPFKIILISHGYNRPVLSISKEKGRGQREKGEKGVGRRKGIYPGEGRKRKGGVRISGGLIPRPWICKWATTSVCVGGGS